MRPNDFFICTKYYYKEIEQQRIFIAELTRLQTIAIINIQLKSTDKIIEPQKLWKFKWEEESLTELSEEEEKESIKRMAELAKVWQKKE